MKVRIWDPSRAEEQLPFSLLHDDRIDCRPPFELAPKLRAVYDETIGYSRS